MAGEVPGAYFISYFSALGVEPATSFVGDGVVVIYEHKYIIKVCTQENESGNDDR